MQARSFSNNKSPRNKVRGSSQIGGGVRRQNNGALDNLREVDDDDLDDDRYDSAQLDMMNDLNSQQINVKNFDLNPQP